MQWTNIATTRNSIDPYSDKGWLFTVVFTTRPGLY